MVAQGESDLSIYTKGEQRQTHMRTENIVPAASRPDEEGPAPPPARPLITAKDIYEVPRLTVQGALAWTLPESAWWPLSRLFGRVNAATHPKRTGNETTQIISVLAGTPTTRNAHRVAVENWANRYEERFQYLRAWRPGGWEPKIDIVGAEHVASALDQGRGIIFWAGNFSFNDLIAKIAWRRLGLAVSHFSRPIHGFSATRFGIRYLNAVRRGIEDRYLGERLMVEERETQIAMQRMRESLMANGAVSITVGNKGRHTAPANFLGGRIALATGALAMGRSTGSAVLPVSTLRLVPGRFEVAIGGAIEVLDGGDGKPDYAAAVQNYVNWVTPFVLRDPGQWRGWRYTSRK